ncbi:hypothetical protein D3C72_2150980 [compost metagenome]
MALVERRVHDDEVVFVARLFARQVEPVEARRHARGVCHHVDAGRFQRVVIGLEEVDALGARRRFGELDRQIAPAGAEIGGMAVEIARQA